MSMGETMENLRLRIPVAVRWADLERGIYVDADTNRSMVALA